MFQVRRYYFTPMWQMKSGISLCFSIIVYLGQASYVLSKPFDFMIFFPSLILMGVVFFCAFQFLKSLLAPTVQIFETEIVVSRLLRRNISKSDIEEFSVKGGRVALKYKWKGQRVEQKFDVREA